MRRNSIFALLCLLVIGCTSVNRPLNSVDEPLRNLSRNQTRASLEPEQIEERFIGLALSGGGLRAANFSAACMFELERLGVLQRVQCISSVSGGSMAAADYCTSKDKDWTIAQAQRDLTVRYQSDVIVQTFVPWNWLALMFTDFDRSDIFANSLDRFLFRGKTFANLREDRPRLLINATDLGSGDGFVFDNESFDRINSDLAKYPLAYAVAASAAFPVALHPVTLRDHRFAIPGYVHLVDGGVYDNLGIRTLVEAYKKAPYKKGAFFIVVDSRTLYETEISHESDVGLSGSTKFGLELSATQLLNSASDDALEHAISDLSSGETSNAAMRKRISDFKLKGIVNFRDGKNRPVTIVHLSLPNAGKLDEAPIGYGHELNEIRTSLNISKDETYSLYKAAERLVHHYEKTLREVVVRDEPKQRGRLNDHATK